MWWQISSQEVCLHHLDLPVDWLIASPRGGRGWCTAVGLQADIRPLAYGVYLQRAGDLMQDLKTGHLIGASPRAQFYAQLIGSTFSIFVTTTAYNVYTKAYEIPGPSFPTPTAYIWLNLARLLSEGPHQLSKYCCTYLMEQRIKTFLRRAVFS